MKTYCYGLFIIDSCVPMFVRIKKGNTQPSSRACFSCPLPQWRLHAVPTPDRILHCGMRASDGAACQWLDCSWLSRLLLWKYVIHKYILWNNRCILKTIYIIMGYQGWVGLWFLIFFWVHVSTKGWYIFKVGLLFSPQSKAIFIWRL